MFVENKLQFLPFKRQKNIRETPDTFELFPKLVFDEVNFHYNKLLLGYFNESPHKNKTKNFRGNYKIKQLLISA